jgi:phospholipase C
MLAIAVTASLSAASSPSAAPSADPAPITPIKHVVVIIGENHSFDNVFGAYQPPAGQRIRNLLSEGIVTSGGGLGPAAAAAGQLTASDTTTFSLTPQITGSYQSLPQPNTTYVSPACDGQQPFSADTRFPANLPNGPYQITKYVPYFDDHSGDGGGCEFFGAYVGDPLHRFYQMSQQTLGDNGQLNTWVANTAGDDNGAIPPAPIFQGAVQMGYYNMAEGDAPILRDLAQHYAISDNYHQAVQGGTGANHIALGTGYAGFYQDASGTPTPPPAEQIENPDPKPGTNNNYTQDGYAGGSYSDCADPSQPGVGPMLDFLNRLPYPVMRNCLPGHYYLLNNYNAGYNVDGSLNTAAFTLPPQHDLPTIADELSARHISWGYFGEGYNNGNPTPAYCPICDPFQYVSSIMTNPALRANIQHDSSDFITEAENGTLPAVSFLKPGDDDGHPGYSTLAAFENFTARAVAAVQDNPKLWRSTAIFVTFDESGGYYDSGYIQPVSFFGDGPRVPLLVVSPFTRPGYVDHTYNDHVSILKFIEANWRLAPLSAVSEDNLPNPTPGAYVPRDRPAIGDLMTLFDFSHPRFATVPLPTYAEPNPATVRAPVITIAQR